MLPCMQGGARLSPRDMRNLLRQLRKPDLPVFKFSFNFIMLPFILLLTGWAARLTRMELK